MIPAFSSLTLNDWPEFWLLPPFLTEKLIVVEQLLPPFRSMSDVKEHFLMVLIFSLLVTILQLGYGKTRIFSSGIYYFVPIYRKKKVDNK
jgi:hypothetical protein